MEPAEEAGLGLDTAEEAGLGLDMAFTGCRRARGDGAAGVRSLLGEETERNGRREC